MRVAARSITETQQFAEDVISVLHKDESTRKRATVLALSGPLGAGKTAFVQCIASLLGISESVVSPTFLLRSDYQTNDDTFSTLTHIDGYRLESTDEANTIGWSEVLASPNTLVAIEWAERFGSHLPEYAYTLTATVGGSEHTFSFSKPV